MAAAGAVRSAARREAAASVRDRTITSCAARPQWRWPLQQGAATGASVTGKNGKLTPPLATGAARASAL